MNFEDAEIENSSSLPGRSKVLGVIVLTDNRENRTYDRSPQTDYRCSAFKGIALDS